MNKIIALVSRKGGIGKSTTISAMAAGFKAKGYRVLVVDMDGQASISHIMDTDMSKPNILDVLTGAVDIHDAVQHTATGEIIAANSALDFADMRLSTNRREFLLKNSLEKIRHEYNLILLDTLPFFGVLTLNALTAATGVILPAQADILSLNALKVSYDLIQSARTNVNPDLAIYGVLLTRFKPRANLSNALYEMFKNAAQAMNTRLFNAKIRETVTVQAAQARQKDIFTYSKYNKATLEYSDFIDELELILKDGVHNGD